MAPHPQGRAWCFTLNNWTEDEEDLVTKWVDTSHATYVIVGHEEGATGTPHLQGFVQWTARRRLGFCRERLPRAHWELSRAKDLHDAAEYCKKDGDWDAYGDLSLGGADNVGGARKRAYDAYVTGGAVACEEAEPLVWAYQGHNLKKNVVREPPARPTVTALWIHGPSGTGKTRAAWQPWLEPVEDQDAGARPYCKLPTVKWWDGYRGQTAVIIDDVCPHGIGIQHLLAWCDKYPCHIETKGGYEPLMATNFIVTSNFLPEEVFPDAKQESIIALRRRFSFELKCF